MMLLQMLAGLLYVNAAEWWVHKHILHGLGKDRQSFWAYHWYEHHAVSAANGMLDLGYAHIQCTRWNTQSKELLVLLGIIMLHLPVLFYLPVFTGTVYGSLLLYYYKHRKAHLDPVWARKHLLWHYEHHLGQAHSANWCVSWPWFDYVLGTRVKQTLQD